MYKHQHLSSIVIRSNNKKFYNLLKKLMLGGLILSAIFIWMILYIIDTDKKKKKTDKKRIAQIRIEAENLVKKLKEFAQKFAKENNKIGFDHFDIEEGGHYYSTLNEKELARVDAIVYKYTFELNFADQKKLDDSFYRIKNDTSLLKKIKNEILNLPDGRNRYIGFD
jgi:hypothetical protein